MRSPSPLDRFLLAVFVALAAVLALQACSEGGSEDPTVPPPPEFLQGSLLFGGRTHQQFHGEAVRAIAADESVLAESTVRENGQFRFAAEELGEFVGRIEVGVLVDTGRGEQTVHLSRDLDLTQFQDGLPLVWIGPVATLASRYRRLHPEASIAASEQLAKDLLGIPPDVELHSGLGDTHRSPFSWSMVLAEFEASASGTLDEHIDGIVADMGAGAVRSYRKPKPYEALHRALYGSSEGSTGPGIMAKPEEGFWMKQLKELPNDAHYSLDAKFVAPGVGWLLHQAGILPSPPSNAELLAELEAIQETIAEMQTAAVGNTYQLAWQNTMDEIGPACARIRLYTQLWQSYLSPDTYSPQLAGLALHEYAAGGTQGMREDFYTLSDMLVGRGAANGPLVSILAADMMLEKYGNQTPDADTLFLPMRTNEALDELRAKQDYFLGHLMLSMNLLMEWAHLDPYAFPYEGLVDGQNLQFQNLEIVRQMLTGEPNAFPVGSRPGYAADIVAAQQLVPPSSLGSDWILADLPGSGVPARTNYWYMNCWYTGTGYWSSANQVQANFQLGPWPKGSFRAAWVDEVLQLRQRALRAVPGDVRGGLRKLGWAGVPSTPQDFYIWSPVSDDTYVQGSGTGDYEDAWLVNMDDGTTKRVNNGSYSYQNDGWVLFVRYGPSGTSQINFSSSNQFPPTFSYNDDAGTAVACTRAPQSLGLASGPQTFPPTVAANYTTTDNLRVGSGGLQTQSISDVLPFGGAASDAFTTRSRLVWRPDLANGAQGFVVSNALDGSSVPFLQLTNSNPSGNILGELHTGYSGAAASFLNTRAAPLTISIPVDSLAGQQVAIPGAPPNAAPVLTSVMAVPSNRVFTNPAQTGIRCYATGFYADSLGQPFLFKDHSVSNINGSVVWSVQSPSGLARFSTSVPNLLLLDPAQGTEQMTITVTVTANGVTKTDRQACWTKY